MSSTEKLGLKLILEKVVESDNISLRRKTIAFALELLVDLGLDANKAEEAMKAEVQSDFKTSNLWLKRIINDLEE